jgi:hypothetical protein
LSWVDDCVDVDSDVVDAFSAPSSAEAIAGLFAIATPMPSATANPPTRPTNRA